MATENLLREHNIPLIALNSVIELPVYIDGADEATKNKHLIKGGGGALTREKIVAAASKQFICIIDDTKLVPLLGNFPLQIEVIPMAQSYVAREITKLGGQPELRQDFITDNGNVILDIHNLNIENPSELENKLNQITGVVTNGLFAKRPADVLIVALNHEPPNHTLYVSVGAMLWAFLWILWMPCKQNYFLIIIPFSFIALHCYERIYLSKIYPTSFLKLRMHLSLFVAAIIFLVCFI